MTSRRTGNRSATDRLKQLVEGELARRQGSQAGTAREAGLPGSVFQSLLRLGKRPSIDRADAICAGIGVSMKIGVETAVTDRQRRSSPRTTATPRPTCTRPAAAAGQRPTPSPATATDRLQNVINGELFRRNITAEEAARNARLPAAAFRSVVRKRNRPGIDRADALLRALGLSMTLGVRPPSTDSGSDDGTNRE